MAGWALAEILLDLAPGLVELLRREGVDVARILAGDVVGHGVAKQRDLAQHVAGSLASDIRGDGVDDIRLAAVLALALVAVEHSIGPCTVVAHVIAGHTTWLCHGILPLKIGRPSSDHSRRHQYIPAGRNCQMT